jgi:hypothetical protein
MEQVAKVYGPVIKQGMEEAKTQMPSDMGDFSGVMDVYLELFNTLLTEVKFISGTVKPDAEALRISKKVQTVEGTELASLFTASDSAGKENKLLVYLEDEAVMNLGAKNHEGLLNKMNEIGMEFFNAVISEEMPAESKEKIDALMQDWSKALGQDIAFSWPMPKGTSAFNFAYVVDVADKEAFDRTIDEGMSFWEDTGMSSFYEDMGIKTGYEVQRGVDTYKEISIDASKFTMEATDVNSPEAQMITQMYKGGFIYRWAMVKDLWVCAIGEDADAEVRELIDTALGDPVKEMGTEMQGALALIDGAEKADFVGTLNYIRLLNVVTKMMPFPLPAMDIPTKSNLIFAGNIGSGQLAVEVVMPKEHMQEIMMLQQMVMQQMMMQQQMQQPMQQHQQHQQPIQPNQGP